MSQKGQELTIWWPKQSSLFEKVKPHRARILFWKLVKKSAKMVRWAHFLYLVPNYGSSGACQQKMSQIGRKLPIWWPKQRSVFEKVKPHRARIFFFWKSVKTVPIWFALPNFFNFIPNYGSSGACPQKMTPNRTKIDDLVTKTMFSVRKS